MGLRKWAFFAEQVRQASAAPKHGARSQACVRHQQILSVPCTGLPTHLELSALLPWTESRRVSARSVPSVQRATSTASRARTAGLKMLRARPPMTTSTVRMRRASWNHSCRQRCAGVGGRQLSRLAQPASTTAQVTICALCAGVPSVDMHHSLARQNQTAESPVMDLQRTAAKAACVHKVANQ